MAPTGLLSSDVTKNGLFLRMIGSVPSDNELPLTPSRGGLVGHLTHPIWRRCKEGNKGVESDYEEFLVGMEERLLSRFLAAIRNDNFLEDFMDAPGARSIFCFGPQFTSQTTNNTAGCTTLHRALPLV